MLVDLRYHIITVVIIFITLALGILIGSTMVGNELIVKEQKRLIDNLEGDFIALRNENGKFQREVNNLENRLANNLEFQKMILPVVVQGQLKEDKLLVVNGSDISLEIREKILEILDLAGANYRLADAKKKETLNKADKILVLGQLDNSLEKEFETFSAEIIKINKGQLETVAGRIKMVFQLAAKDLARLRSVNFE